MRRVLRVFQSLWLPFKLCAITLPFLIVIFLTIGYVHVGNQARCLTDVIDADLSYTAQDATGNERVIALKQIEAIARVRLKLAREGRASVCPEGWKWDYFTPTLRGYAFGDTRKNMIYPIAWWSVAGWHHFDWPEKYACVDEFQATDLRVWKTAKCWLNDCAEVGKIGTMRLFCSKKGSRKKALVKN